MRKEVRQVSTFSCCLLCSCLSCLGTASDPTDRGILTQLYPPSQIMIYFPKSPSPSFTCPAPCMSLPHSPPAPCMSWLSLYTPCCGPNILTCTLLPSSHSTVWAAQGHIFPPYTSVSPPRRSWSPLVVDQCVWALWIPHLRRGVD